MEPLYLLLAYLIALVHVAYMGFYLWLIMLSLRGRLSRYPVYLTLFWLWIGGKIASYYILGGCILTFSEQYLRVLATGHTYTGGYIEHYSSLLGVHLSIPTVEGLVVTPLIISILSELWWYKQRRSLKTV